LLAFAAWGQAALLPFDVVQSADYELSYHVPGTWNQLCQTTDSITAVSYLNPDESIRNHRGHVLLLYMQAKPDAFSTTRHC
jgi:hypothetical protein